MTRKERQEATAVRRTEVAGRLVAEMIVNVEAGDKTTEARVWLQRQIEIHCAGIPQHAEFYRQVSSEARHRFDAWANARARERASGRRHLQQKVAC